MAKRTLEEYKIEFEKIKPVNSVFEWTDTLISKYEELINECIIDYPNEELGYEEKGNIILDKNVAFDTTFSSEIGEIIQKTKNNPMFAKTLIYIFAKPNLPEHFFVHIYKIPIHENFAEVLYRIGMRVLQNTLNAKFANHYFDKACESGWNDYDFLEFLNCPLDNIEIENFICISDKILLNNLSNIKEIYFLGENGVGKTVLLQAILLGLVDNAENKTNNSKIHVELNISGRYSYLNVFAYGTSRFREGDRIAKTGYDTLFDRNTLLINPLTWFEKVWLREKANVSMLSIETVKQFFTEIINFEDNTDFRIEQEGSKFTFYEQNTLTEFEHLAEGYRSVLIWLSDLLSRLTENQPYIKDLKDFYGIVLVDEIDMFLHPKWEYTIVSKLREKLPNIQWFFTTHSPMLILGATDEAVFYKVYKENGKTQISEQYTFEQIGSFLANGIITSPLFDLEFSGMRELLKKERPDMETADTYLHSRINKFILQKSKESKKKRTYISPETIDKWIIEALELNEGGKL